MASSSTTHERQFLPYRFKEHGIEVGIEGCWLDDRPAKIAADAERHLLDLSGQPFARVAIALVATVPRNVLTAVLSPAELLAPPIKLLVLVRCAATRLRAQLELGTSSALRAPHDFAPDDATRSARYTGRLTLARDDLRGAVEITGLLVRSENSLEHEAGRAAEANLRLASARTWELRIDPGPTPPGEYLDTRQEDFLQAGAIRFPEPEALYHLDCDGEAPILWINSRHHRVAGILHSAANTGRSARIRDVVFDRIEAAVWPRLFLRAARALHETGDPPFTWQAAVLRKWLPELYPQCGDHEGRLVALRQELDSAEGPLLDRLDLALQRQTRAAGHFDLLVQEIEP